MHGVFRFYAGFFIRRFCFGHCLPYCGNGFLYRMADSYLGRPVVVGHDLNITPDNIEEKMIFLLHINLQFHYFAGELKNILIVLEILKNIRM